MLVATCNAPTNGFTTTTETNKQQLQHVGHLGSHGGADKNS